MLREKLEQLAEKFAKDEVSGFFGKDVYHLQASPTVGVDVTRFRWYSDEEVRAAFGAFKIESFETEKTYYYCCTKRDRA